MFAALLLAILPAVQPLTRADLKEFDAAYELLHTARSKGRIDILAKYGPEVLSKYDLIQIQFESGNSRRDTYDSLSSWVGDAQSRLKVLGSIEEIAGKSPSQVALALAKIEPVIDLVVDPVQRDGFRRQTSQVALQSFGPSCPLDTLYKVRNTIPQRFQRELQLQKRVAKGIDDEYLVAFNQGGAALVAFETRFPGAKTSQVQGALDFAAADEVSILLRSKSREGLLKAYRSPSIPQGKPKAQVGAMLEKILYNDWAKARVHDAEVRAAKDFLEVFRSEPKKSSKYEEIESWLYYNSGEAPVIAVNAPPGPVATQPLPPGSP